MRYWNLQRGKQRIRGSKLVPVALIVSLVVFWTAFCGKLRHLSPVSLFDSQPSPSANAALPGRIKLLINSDICGEHDVFMVIVVHSAIFHRDYRDAIRKSWGATDPLLLPPIRTAFMLGIPSNRSEQRQLDEENQRFGDLVQGDFVDSYKNLTYKHIMGLGWAGEYCSRARFVMKMDDDIFVDVFKLVGFLQPRSIRKAVACYFQHQMPVVRDPVSKWYVSKQEFSPETFEDYCSGWAYVTDPTTAKLLSETALQMPYFWVDDVHITGAVARKAQVAKVNMNRYYALETQGLVDWTRSDANMSWDKIFAPTWGDLELMRRAHRKAQLCRRRNCACCFSKPSQTTTTTRPKPITGRSIIKALALRSSG